jgi:hypothetical protein
MSVPPELAAREGGGNPFVPWPRGRNARVDLYPISQPLLSMLICLFNDVGWGVLEVVKQAIVLPIFFINPFLAFLL